MVINNKKKFTALVLATFFIIGFLATGCGKKMPPKAPIETSMMSHDFNSN